MSLPTVMFDSVDVNELPANTGNYAYAAYINGSFANYSAIKAAHPNAEILTISVTANEDAVAVSLDVEPGDATISEIFEWFTRQVNMNKVYRPVIYTSAGNLSTLYATMSANGLRRGSYRVWSAHYGAGQHICGPSTCGFNLGGTAADGTQWTDTALGRNLDESLLSSTFFAPAPNPQAGQPKDVKATARWTNATIEWQPGTGTVDHYVAYIAGEGGKIFFKSPDLTPTTRSYKFGHLAEKTTYQVGVFAAPSTDKPVWVPVTTK